ncbi:pilus assembly PilX family protein [Saccharophagus degradans]|uniref:PilX N-terminal domain-containing pilus assembly protein n=1 Tax=Saccharophagus degradans TaxID=86304 RepID=A0AAW7XBT9_9GAMM|nr:PilX N-terminal domain-containing pilus assembly protein [Saccharophagus degradans]MDO6424685.1 PilX N-terminal domain-containing pilus assembly protein [Saccharophagus degradans]MDO6609018.1 PilX N-terminal domain-containing pilus assembly protein [Saccharophagus degradans]
MTYSSISNGRGREKALYAQGGAALIVALVLLAAISLIGVANMQSSTLEVRMAASTLDREKAFAIVDSGLREAERKLSNSMNLKLADLQSDVCTTKCFTADCPNGLCFDGVYDTSKTRIECEVAPDADSVERLKFWEQASVWNTSSKHDVVQVKGQIVKYIYEFLCFVPSGSGPFNGDSLAQANSGEPLFRITAYSESDGDRAPVMLQSTVVIGL